MSQNIRGPEPVLRAQLAVGGYGNVLDQPPVNEYSMEVISLEHGKRGEGGWGHGQDRNHPTGDAHRGLTIAQRRAVRNDFGRGT